jgi:hypothetical protein
MSATQRSASAGGAHEREDDALGARVERELDLAGVDGRDPHERRAARPGGRGDHRVQALAPDRPVLAVDDDEVRARGGDRLGGDGGRDDGDDAAQGRARAEAVPEEHGADLPTPEAGRAVLLSRHGRGAARDRVPRVRRHRDAPRRGTPPDRVAGGPDGPAG